MTSEIDPHLRHPVWQAEAYGGLDFEPPAEESAEPAGEKRMIVESPDGGSREVVYDVGSRLVKRSRVIEGRIPRPPIHTTTLTVRQRRGLGLPPDFVGLLADDEEDPELI